MIHPITGGGGGTATATLTVLGGSSQVSVWAPYTNIPITANGMHACAIGVSGAHLLLMLVLSFPPLSFCGNPMVAVSLAKKRRVVYSASLHEVG